MVKINKIQSYVYLLIIIGLLSIWGAVSGFINTLPDRYDGILITWILNQNIQKIPGDIENIFQGNIFYPAENTMLFSDFFLPSSLISYLPAKITNSPASAFNFSFVVSQVLVSLILYLWFKDITKSEKGAFLGSLVFILSQIRFHYIVHLQMWSLQWFLLASYFVWKFAGKGKTGFLYLSSIFASLAFWESPLPFYFFLSLYIVTFIIYPKHFLNNKRQVVNSQLLTLIIILPLAYSYFSTAKLYGLERTIRDAAHFSMGVEEVWTKFLSPSMYFLGLFSIAYIYKKKVSNKEVLWLLVTCGAGLIMALGPVLKIGGVTFKLFGIPIPLPYALVYYLLPGFNAMRTPSRWIIVFAVALSGLIATVSTKLINKRRLLFPILFVIILIGGSRYKNYSDIPMAGHYPNVYKWLEERPEKAIFEYPVFNYTQDNFDKEFLRMLYSLEHRKNIFNGSAGFYPPGWETLASQVNANFPDSILDLELKRLNLDLVLVDKNLVGKEEFINIDMHYTDRKVYEDSNYAVFRI